METSSLPDYKSFDRTSSNTVSPYITLGILVAGVAGGLIIVIAFILFCKYCVKKKHIIRRDQGTDCERSSERRFKPFQRYETVNSDVFSEPSTGSMDGLPLSPRKLKEGKSHEKITFPEEAKETSKLKSDYEKPTYKEIEHDTADLFTNESEHAPKAVPETTKETESTGRRVSFQIDAIPPTGYLRKGRRYTDGDFHYLKNLRITKKNVPRQYSYAVCSGGRDINDKVMDHGLELQTIAGESPVSDVSLDIETCFNEYSKPHILDTIASSQTAHSHSILDSPSPPDDSVGPQIVNVEVHYRNRNMTKHIPRVPYTGIHSERTASPKIVNAFKPTSHSLDAMSSTHYSSRTNRRVKSYDDALEYDYDILKITEFSRGPFHNNDFDPIVEVDALGSSKVRYNDMGSIEMVNDETLYMFDDFDYETVVREESDADTETTLNGTQKYREIWNLRTTLEEEEECSDSLRMEDMASPDDHSPDRGDNGGSSYSPTYQPALEAAQFHEHDERAFKNDHLHSLPIRGLAYIVGQYSNPEDSNLLHPNYENRRETFKKVINKRYPRKGYVSTENSFDSVEPGDTDDDVSDTSRHEVTTSFESTTDNTDSTNDSTHRLRQMKADSGYKSLETHNPPTQTHKPGAKRSQSISDDIEVLEQEITTTPKTPEVLEGVGTNDSVTRRGSIFEKRKGRTASKRRREYSRERQVVRLYESLQEPETDSARSDQPSGDSMEEPITPSSKFSVFSRFFKNQKYQREKSLIRDFSIDEKSNNLFHEFTRIDPKFEHHRGSTASIVGDKSRRGRLQRKYTDPGPVGYDDSARHWLSPEMRSTSLGSESSGASSARRITPEDSIEEEDIEDDIDAAVMDHKNRIMEEQCAKTEDISTPTVSVHEIPIIKLPEGESVEA